MNLRKQVVLWRHFESDEAELMEIGEAISLWTQAWPDNDTPQDSSESRTSRTSQLFLGACHVFRLNGERIKIEESDWGKGWVGQCWWEADDGFSNNSLGTAGTRAGQRRLQRLELTEELPVSWLPARPPPTLQLLQAVHLLLHLYSTFYKHCIHFFSSTLLISGQQQRASLAAWARGWVGRDPGRRRRRRRRTGHSWSLSFPPTFPFDQQHFFLKFEHISCSE